MRCARQVRDEQRLPDGSVIGVLGASGGLGTSSFAAVLGLVAGTLSGAAVLIDLDPAAGGVDVLLGLEGRPGARWSGLRLAGGVLDPVALADGLPRAGPCAVLAADRLDDDPGAVGQVLGAAVALGPVVLDLPRADGPGRAAAVQACDLVVLLVRPDVTGLVAARAACDTLPEHAVGAVLRRSATRGGFTRWEVEELVGVPVLGTLPVVRRPRPVAVLGRVPRAHRRVAAGILAGVARGAPTISPVPGRTGGPATLTTASVTA